MILLKPRELQPLLARRRAEFAAVEDRVREIIRRVQEEGDAALRDLTRRYDGVELDDFVVSRAERAAARKSFLTLEWRRRLERVSRRVSNFARRELPSGLVIKEEEGIIERVFVPLDSAGVYVPAGTAPLVSSVIMGVVPAITAGVKRIAVCTPPGKDGRANQGVVATADFLGIKEIYKVGGAQAIAALARGTETIVAVKKIVGPGNEYVSAAKTLLYGVVDIDCPAGPSEVVVWADGSSKVDYVLAEIAGQAEHYRGLALLLTGDEGLVRRARDSDAGGYVMRLDSEQAVRDTIAAVAPEHLVVMTRDAARQARKIRHAGVVFVGAYSPVAIGDYLAGPSHILPTGGTAGSFSGLSSPAFLRSFARVRWNRQGLARWSDDIMAFARTEGLPAHEASVKIRLKREKKRPEG